MGIIEALKRLFQSPLVERFHIPPQRVAPVTLLHRDVISVAYTSDLHIERCKTSQLDEFVNQLRESQPDILIVGGDTSNGDSALWADVFARLGDIAAVNLTVPGNHDMWSQDKYPTYGSSDFAYRNYIETARAGGFIPLDVDGPVAVNGIGFAGCMGWYDYTMRNPHVQASMRNYRRKRADVIQAGWNDGVYVSWSWNDEKVTYDQLARMRKQLSQLEADDTIGTIVVANHHIPYSELIRCHNGTDYKAQQWNFNNAFMGSVKFGELYDKSPKVRTVFCGHSHARKIIKAADGRIEVIMNGRPGMPAFVCRQYQVTNQLCGR